MTLVGFFLGRTIPNTSQRIHYVILVVIILSLLPAIISVLRARRAEQLPNSSPVITPEKP
jgi:hypothetical protein